MLRPCASQWLLLNDARMLVDDTLSFEATLVVCLFECYQVSGLLRLGSLAQWYRTTTQQFNAMLTAQSYPVWPNIWTCHKACSLPRMQHVMCGMFPSQTHQKTLVAPSLGMLFQAQLAVGTKAGHSILFATVFVCITSSGLRLAMSLGSTLIDSELTSLSEMCAQRMGCVLQHAVRTHQSFLFAFPSSL